MSFTALGVASRWQTNKITHNGEQTMAVLGEIANLSGEEFLEHSAELHLLLALNQDRFNALCVLLSESSQEASLFRRSVKRRLEQGYQLTSLVADLHCGSPDATPAMWICDVLAPHLGPDCATQFGMDPTENCSSWPQLRADENGAHPEANPQGSLLR